MVGLSGQLLTGAQSPGRLVDFPGCSSYLECVSCTGEQAVRLSPSEGLKRLPEALYAQDTSSSQSVRLCKITMFIIFVFPLAWLVFPL